MDGGRARRELEIVTEQIGALKQSLRRLDKVLAAESEKLVDFENLVTMTGIGARSAGVPLSVKGFDGRFRR